jgi:hypothetical protein
LLLVAESPAEVTCSNQNGSNVTDFIVIACGPISLNAFFLLHVFCYAWVLGALWQEIIEVGNIKQQKRV